MYVFIIHMSDIIFFHSFLFLITDVIRMLSFL